MRLMMSCLVTLIASNAFAIRAVPPAKKAPKTLNQPTPAPATSKSEKNTSLSAEEMVRRRKASRPQRANAARQRLNKRLKARFGTKRPQVLRDELEKHARRMAKLERIRELAILAADNQSLTRVNRLTVNETIRHNSALEILAGPKPTRVKKEHGQGTGGGQGGGSGKGQGNGDGSGGHEK